MSRDLFVPPSFEFRAGQKARYASFRRISRIVDDVGILQIFQRSKGIDPRVFRIPCVMTREIGEDAKLQNYIILLHLLEGYHLSIFNNRNEAKDSLEILLSSEISLFFRPIADDHRYTGFTKINVIAI